MIVMAEESAPADEKSVDSHYGYDDEKKKSFIEKITDFIRQKEGRAFKGMKDVT